MPSRIPLKRILIARPPKWSAGDLVWLGVALAIVAIQRVGVSLLDIDGAEGGLRRTIFFVTTGALILLAFRWRWYAGAWLIGIGIFLNFIPMVSHGGLMPVAYETIQDSGEFPEITDADIGRQVTNSKDIVLPRSEIDFEPLSDRYVITFPLYRTNIYSFGDFIAFAGIALVLVQVIGHVVFGGRAKVARAAPICDDPQGA